ncbi:MAG: hybrid sensor histidine kinase/response regulator [Myxococcales bacterium]|nr:hybrid sensor histidine kinase/response regulator [Myxococcales bacterium]
MARVLHIEDDPNNRLLVRKLLTPAGHEVIDAETGLEGIRLADSVRPELILVDINIPDLDGYEVTLRLRGMASVRGVPIVAITAEGDKQTSLAVGADGFIEKPIDAKRFPLLVERFLKGHRERADRTGPVRLREQSQKIVEHLEVKVRELSKANERLEEMARLRREFLRNVSHELATPMTPVVGYLKLLLDGELGALTPIQKKTLESISASTVRLRSVINTLLDVSSLESGQMHFFAREYDFVEMVKKALRDTRPTFDDAGVAVVEESWPPPLAAVGDSEKIRRAFVHVLDNAAKFTPRGATVGVGIRWTDREPVSYGIVVADDGPGVAPDQLRRIMEPFYQVDGSVTRAHGGVGLGLAFARSVAEAMGGGLEVQSPPVQSVAGRTFSGTAITLWVQAQPRRRTSAPPAPELGRT